MDAVDRSAAAPSPARGATWSKSGEGRKSVISRLSKVEIREGGDELWLMTVDHSTELRDFFRGKSANRVAFIGWTTSQPILKLASAGKA